MTLRTSWTNADLALKNLKDNNLHSLRKLSQLTELEYLAHLVRPVGFYQSKPRRLFEFASYVVKTYKNISQMQKEDAGILSAKLLNITSIGPENTDTILLYALDKEGFVIDKSEWGYCEEVRLVIQFP